MKGWDRDGVTGSQTTCRDGKAHEFLPRPCSCGPNEESTDAEWTGSEAHLEAIFDSVAHKNLSAVHYEVRRDKWVRAVMSFVALLESPPESERIQASGPSSVVADGEVYQIGSVPGRLDDLLLAPDPAPPESGKVGHPLDDYRSRLRDLFLESDIEEWDVDEFVDRTMAVVDRPRPRYPHPERP